MMSKEPIGQLEMEYLLALYALASGKAKTAIPFNEVHGRLSRSDDDAGRCCDFLTGEGFLEWPALGHVALTHLGLAAVERVQSNSETADGVGGPRSISVVIPTLDEVDTIAYVVKLALSEPRVLEVLVVDDGSIDGTPDVAVKAGASVIMSTFLGKGASMRDGLRATRGEVVVFIDGDVSYARDDVIEKVATPILRDEADFVQGGFTRDGGRVTILTAKPLLASFFPELSVFGQPLGGVLAARRSALVGIELESGYGVDVGLLIDVAMKGRRVVEVDIGRMEHDSRPLDALGEMAKEVTRVILDRAWKYDRLKINQVRELEELERRARADVRPAFDYTTERGKYALIDMDGVLLDGRFAVEMASRMGALSDLAPFLDNRAIPDADRIRLIGSLFTGAYRESFEETAMSMPLMEGAAEMVVALRRAGYRVGVVSDSFILAAETVRRRVFADFCVAHALHFRNGISTGDVAFAAAMIDPQGCDLHEICKGNIIGYLSRDMGLVPEETIAVGDGENDICLLRRAGISVAFRPKSDLVGDAANHIVDGPLLDVLKWVPDVDLSKATVENG